ncbi:hypothetical protein AOXY_G29167 [Acipenser oxyrinchus oxyrinchus]|uniref:Uncharacterized protein n=1 Tax=Acipenser oxyrinchus oxyrinchus TaxID=40147 RepID=A0AAD8FU45_ACIOX|nr:hypothetical protein AOXY_G29167 [Acipenser oxyrinchus oxyrinchus]
MHAGTAARRGQRAELAERRNKHAAQRLSCSLSSLEQRCGRRLALLQEERRQLRLELLQIRTEKTPSLENLAVEFPPDFPKPHLFRKRLSLPSLQSSRADLLARRRSLTTVPEDFQKRINSFLSDLDLLKGGVSEECVAVATEEGAGQEQVGEERRGRQRKDWAAVPLEEALREVRLCRYLRHGERPDWERELRLEEIFCKEEGRSERAGEESTGLQRD